MTIEIKDNILYYDGYNTLDLAKKYGTPLYVYSQSEIMNRINELKVSFLNKYENTRVAYACKAFSNTGFFRLLDREGLSLDVVSGGELYTAMKADFPGERIEFNGNNKSREELEMAVDYGVGRIIVDGLEELYLLRDIAREKNKLVNILFRITPGVKGKTHDYISTGGVDSKFGIPLVDEILFNLIGDAIDFKEINFLGFHFHIGSQLFENEGYVNGIKVLLSIIEGVKEKFSYDIEEINIGGGFGIKYTDEERKPFSFFLDPAMELINSYYREKNIKRPSIVIEPGRSIVGEAGISLYKIGNIKDIEGIRKYVSVDGGMTDNIRPALYQAKYKADICNKMLEDREEVVTICGKCCESGDILIRDIELPKVDREDILVIYSTGAYGHSMASNYNRLTIPAVVMVNEGQDFLLSKRQSYEDMVGMDIIPDHLL